MSSKEKTLKHIPTNCSFKPFTEPFYLEKLCFHFFNAKHSDVLKYNVEIGSSRELETNQIAKWWLHTEHTHVHSTLRLT